MGDSSERQLKQIMPWSGDSHAHFWQATGGKEKLLKRSFLNETFLNDFLGIVWRGEWMTWYTATMGFFFNFHIFSLLRTRLVKILHSRNLKCLTHHSNHSNIGNFSFHAISKRRIRLAGHRCAVCCHGLCIMWPCLLFRISNISWLCSKSQTKDTMKYNIQCIIFSKTLSFLMHSRVSICYHQKVI